MAGIVPPLALIPVHGIVQLDSNAGRALMTRRHVVSRVVGYFALGSLLAALLASFVLGHIAPSWIPLFVGLFILLLAWVPLPRFNHGTHPLGLFTCGLLTTLATTLVGATAPLVSAWLGRNGNRWH